MAYVRTVKTASGALAVQIVHSNRGGSREIEHIGSAHSPGEVELLKAAAQQRLRANQDTLDLDDGRPVGEALPITSTQSRQLWDALCGVYDRLGFAAVTGGDEVFRSLVLARLVEPVSKLDTIRVLTELGINPPGYRTIFRRLPEYAKDEWRQQLAGACADHVRLGPATLMLYDVTTLYFETDQGDGFREPGFSKERRLEPQITVGLLTDVRGFPLQVHAFTGNTAETKTMIPVIEAFTAAYSLPGVTVVADAGMMSEANCKDLEDAGLTFIVGARIPDVPYQVAQWRRDHPDQPIPDQQVFVQPTTMGPKADQRKRTIFYQYRTDRAKRTMKGIDTQIAKAEQAVAGKTAVKRNRFVQLTGAKKAVNRDLETKTRALAGLKGYVTNLPEPTPEFVMGAYHQLWQVEKSFRMSKSDLRARPIYHHKREPIEAHLTVVMAALAVARIVERGTGWSISRFVKALRPCRTITIKAGDQTITAADPIPTDALDALTRLRTAVAH